MIIYNIIIRRGIDTNHKDFHGRAKFGVDYVDSPALKGDPNGHGTHVAGEEILLNKFIRRYYSYKPSIAVLYQHTII